MGNAGARAVAAIATALLLGACGDLTLMAEAGRAPASRFSGPPPLDPPSAPQPPRLIDVPPGTLANSSSQATSSTVALAAPRAPAAPNPNAGQPLYGLASNAVVAALGPAGFVRRDGPAEIWRYSAVPCFLDVFFYRESDGQKVNYVAARPRNAAHPVTTDSCYRALLAERNGGAAG